MGKRRRKGPKLPTLDPVHAEIESITHEGRGVTHIDGKAVFIDGALPGEKVTFRYTNSRKQYDEGKVEEVLTRAEKRVDPKCEHFGYCGGCRWQHLSADVQIAEKQKILEDNFERIGKVAPQTMLEPLRGPVWGYRKKARLGVKNVPKKGRVLVGFRELGAPYIADIKQCEVLDPRVGYKLEALSDLIGELQACSEIPQIEVAISDDRVALVFRHLKPLVDTDVEKLIAFGETEKFDIYLQPGGYETIHFIGEKKADLIYSLPAYDVDVTFLPADFTQVNSELNQKMVPHALTLLDAQPGDTILDLFCGLGNFTLPIARSGADVIGVEGDKTLVERAELNAKNNGIENVTFFTADLTKDVTTQSWMQTTPNKILIDPPRSGALEMLPHINKLGPQKIVYVSCHPGTLARDAHELVNEYGYTMTHAGVMDMFPHTAHVESIACFEKLK